MVQEYPILYWPFSEEVFSLFRGYTLDSLLGEWHVAPLDTSDSTGDRVSQEQSLSSGSPVRQLRPVFVL